MWIMGNNLDNMADPTYRPIFRKKKRAQLAVSGNVSSHIIGNKLLMINLVKNINDGIELHLSKILFIPNMRGLIKVNTVLFG